ncbi:hypothetical protein D1007_53354 [Hordeum vulgare]|nr:hypothetical protein D1007_53354 [Hordeum vulgare]
MTLASIGRPGKKSFSLDRRSGGKKYMIPAKALCYGWSGYLAWSRCHPHSRFQEVAVLSHLCWLDVYGILNTKNLSGVGKDYAAYLVYRVHWLPAPNTAQKQSEEATASSTVAICNHECNHLVPHNYSRSPLWDWDWELDGLTLSSALVAMTEKNQSRKRPDGVSVRSDGRWVEQEIKIELDEQCLEGKESNVSVEFRGLTGSHGCEIIIEGIEVRPITMDC